MNKAFILYLFFSAFIFCCLLSMNIDIVGFVIYYGVATILIVFYMIFMIVKERVTEYTCEYKDACDDIV